MLIHRFLFFVVFFVNQINKSWNERYHRVISCIWSFVSRLIRYARTWSTFDRFLKQGKLRQKQIINQDHKQSRLNSSVLRVCGRYIGHLSKYNRLLGQMLTDVFILFVRVLLFSRLRQRAHGWCVCTADAAHPSVAPDLLYFYKGPCLLCPCFVLVFLYSFGLFILNTVLLKKCERCL